jgi:hypothetical protein
MSRDPVITNPELYRVILENDRVRVLEYLDQPGDRTHPHQHPDTVMITLSAFRRRLSEGGHEVDVELPEHQARWVSAQEHSGQNIGDTATHSIFIELKEAANRPAPNILGPSPA